MKIITTLTTIDPLKGGGVCEVVYNLNKHIFEVCPEVDLKISSLDYDTSKDVRNNWKIFRTSLHKVHDPFYYGISPGLKNDVLSSNADILHNHGVWEYTSNICLIWKKRLRKPYIVTPHGMLDSWSINNSRFKKRILYNLLEKKYLSNANCIHALNKEEARSIRKMGLKNPVCVIPNGIDLPDTNKKFAPVWNIEKDKKVLLFLGRLHPKKGLENLLLSWKILAKNNEQKDWVLVIAGWSQNDYDKKLKSMVSENDLTDSVIFLGSVLGDDKASVLQNADAFVLPSFSEGLPMSVLEAWSYKLPVLMTKECNLSEAFSKDCAIEITTDEYDIADKLSIFFKMEEEDRKELAENAFSLASKKYTWESVAKQMCDVYQWVLGQGKKPDTILKD